MSETQDPNLLSRRNTPVEAESNTTPVVNPAPLNPASFNLTPPVAPLENGTAHMTGNPADDSAFRQPGVPLLLAPGAGGVDASPVTETPVTEAPVKTTGFHIPPGLGATTSASAVDPVPGLRSTVAIALDSDPGSLIPGRSVIENFLRIGDCRKELSVALTMLGASKELLHSLFGVEEEADSGYIATQAGPRSSTPIPGASSSTFSQPSPRAEPVFRGPGVTDPQFYQLPGSRVKCPPLLPGTRPLATLRDYLFNRGEFGQRDANLLSQRMLAELTEAAATEGLASFAALHLSQLPVDIELTRLAFCQILKAFLEGEIRLCFNRYVRYLHDRESWMVQHFAQLDYLVALMQLDEEAGIEPFSVGLQTAISSVVEGVYADVKPVRSAARNATRRQSSVLTTPEPGLMEPDGTHHEDSIVAMWEDKFQEAAIFSRSSPKSLTGLPRGPPAIWPGSVREMTEPYGPNLVSLLRVTTHNLLNPGIPCDIVTGNNVPAGSPLVAAGIRDATGRYGVKGSECSARPEYFASHHTHAVKKNKIVIPTWELCAYLTPPGEAPGPAVASELHADTGENADLSAEGIQAPAIRHQRLANRADRVDHDFLGSLPKMHWLLGLFLLSYVLKDPGSVTLGT